MKNSRVSGLFFLIILIASLNNSCTKEDTKPQPEGITIVDLYGSWVFLNLEFNGKTTWGCDSTLNRSYDFVTISFYSVTWEFFASSPYMYLSTNCMDSGDEPQWWQKNYKFTMIDSVINCNDEIKFKIVNIGPYEDLWALKVKLIYSSIPDVPLNGMYTLGKTPF